MIVLKHDVSRSIRPQFINADMRSPLDQYGKPAQSANVLTGTCPDPGKGGTLCTGVA